MRSILSFDLHRSDTSYSIETCNANLTEGGFRAAFFIPTRMLDRPDFHGPLRALAGAGHELGTHCHEHNDEEMRKSRLRNRASSREYMRMRRVTRTLVRWSSPSSSSTMRRLRLQSPYRR